MDTFRVPCYISGIIILNDYNVMSACVYYCNVVNMQNKYEETEGEAEQEFHRRNHHTTMKNQNTTTRKTIYHSQRQPCREAMLFIRRNVPDKIPDVSANASFI